MPTWTRAVPLLAALACSFSAAPEAPATPEASETSEAAGTSGSPVEPETPAASQGMTKVDRPDPLPKPLTVEQLGVHTARTLVVLATSPGSDADEDGFQLAVSQLQALRMPVMVSWLGCQPEAVEAVGQTGERWMATLSFAERSQAELYVQAKGLSPLAIVDGEVEPCGD